MEFFGNYSAVIPATQRAARPPSGAWVRPQAGPAVVQRLDTRLAMPDTQGRWAARLARRRHNVPGTRWRHGCADARQLAYGWDRRGRPLLRTRRRLARLTVTDRSPQR